MLLRQQVIITLASHFRIPTQSISHHIILTRDVKFPSSETDDKVQQANVVESQSDLVY